ncbi:MAG: CDP-glycerol glycerophosphotransferase family protein [Cognaticolwellia sp.]
MKIIFDVLHLYYLPQYLPVYQQLIRENAGNASFVFYRGIHDDIIKTIIAKEQLSHIWVDNSAQARDYYCQEQADWVFFANAFAHLDKVHQVSKSVQLGHGIGPKASYYTKSSTATTVRFVEGNYRTQRLKAMYPNDCFVDVGFCKLDPIINNELPNDSLAQWGLDATKKTLLYAPTFYPSSIECFADNWPELYAQYNIIIKPHYFSLAKETYQAQRKLLERWSQYDNVYLAQVDDYSLVPFMALADVLISDASSALFEFAALNKPVIWCDFLKLRWSYRGIFSYRFKKRMDQDYGEYADVAVHAKSFKNLQALVKQQIEKPNELAQTRLALADKLCGKIDGKASSRIINYLQNPR